MGNRLSKITTRTGDAGQTGLAGDTRLPKTAPRIEAIGEVDELNAVIGLWRSAGLPEAADTLLADISQQLFNLGGELAMPGETLLAEAALAELEAASAAINATLPPLREFILPGGPPPVAWAHLARTVCRRAERRLWALAEAEGLRALPAQYLNRLSDLCFVLGRELAQQGGAAETSWQHARR